MLASPSPGRSIGRDGPVDWSILATARATAATPIGTFSQKIHCQDHPSTIAPPASGPSAIASPLMAPQNPSARPRRSGDAAADSSVSVRGVMIPPPAP
jgi:hypothetical protein